MDNIIQSLNQILPALNEVARYIPFDAAIWAPVLSPVLLAIKKVVKIKNGELMIWLTILGSMLFGVFQYYKQTRPDDPSLAAVNGIVILLATQPFYRLILKPLYDWVAKEITKAVLLNESKDAVKDLPVVPDK